MDPQATRDEIAKLLARKCSQEGDAERLEELRAALEEWERKGGF